MFEAGGQLKARYGAENVYDFSLGNPDLPAPAAVGEGLRRFAEHAGEPFAFGYMPNAGFPWAREQLAAHLSKEQGVALEACCSPAVPPAASMPSCAPSSIPAKRC
jgi:aspartate aminotransferase